MENNDVKQKSLNRYTKKLVFAVPRFTLGSLSGGESCRVPWVRPTLIQGHLQERRFGAGLDAVINRALEAGVTRMVSCGTEESDWWAMLELALPAELLALSISSGGSWSKTSSRTSGNVNVRSNVVITCPTPVYCAQEIRKMRHYKSPGTARSPVKSN